MNVLYISHDASLYGATRSLLNLIDKLYDYGVTPYVILPFHGEMERELRRRRIVYKVIVSGNNYRKIGERNLCQEICTEVQNIKSIMQISKLMKRWNIDLVHTNNLCRDVGAIAAKLCDKPHVWHMREFMEEDFNIEFLNKYKMKYLLNHSDVLITISNSVYEKYKNLYNKNRMYTISNGVPIDEYTIKRTEYFAKDILSILFCGAISESKGQFEAIKAIEHLLGQNCYNVKLYIVGQGKKEYVNQLKRYVKNADLTEKVQFFGFQKEMKNIRINMDIALICSKMEAFGRVTIESMLSELLVIGANTAGTSELIKHKNTGLLYEKGNHKDLADKIKWVIDNKEDAKELIVSAKSHAKRKYSIERVGKNIYTIYQNVMKNHYFA